MSMDDAQRTEQLLRAKQGDKNAFSLLWQDMHSELLVWARNHVPKYIQSKHSASDVLQEVALKMWQILQGGTFLGTTLPEFRSYTFEVLKTKEMNLEKPFRQPKRKLDREVHSADEDGHDPLQEIPDQRFPRASLPLHQQEEREELERRIARLPERQAQVARLRLLENQSLGQIASAMNINVPAISALLSRAMKELKK